MFTEWERASLSGGRITICLTELTPIYINIYTIPFETEVVNYRNRALQDADKNCKTVNNFARNVTLFIKKALMLLERDSSI